MTDEAAFQPVTCTFFGNDDVRWCMPWATLFERADEHETSVADVRASLARRRGTDSGDETTRDSTEEDSS